MNIEIDLLEEPSLEFNQHFLHSDKKTGLSEFGPYGRCDPALHKESIRVGVVGTRANVQEVCQWIDQLATRIETDKSKLVEESLEDEEGGETVASEILVKGLYPDFVGFNQESSFGSRFVYNERWFSYYTKREVHKICDIGKAAKRVEAASDLIMEHIQTVATATPQPDIIIIPIPKMFVDAASTAKVGKGVSLDLRRSLKARSMKWGVPLQLVKEHTLTRKKGLQDVATRAWNFSTAIYFKAGGIPWVSHGLEKSACYVGITFYRTEDDEGRVVLRSAVAQAFDYLGQGVVLRGDPFDWEPPDLEEDRTPHLREDEAEKLIKNVLTEYTKISGRSPTRVVIHKSSRFWGDESRYNEKDGFVRGVESHNRDAAIDLVSIQQSPVILARHGNYPPLRGTFVNIEDSFPIIYTHGFTPYFDTYPGVHVPRPWAILDHFGDSSVRAISQELLALTKMNVNNTDFADSTPITLSFSRKVSEILKHIGPGMEVRAEYKFYM